MKANEIRQALTDLSVAHVYDGCKQTINNWRDRLYAEINAQHSNMQKQLQVLYQEVCVEVEDFKVDELNVFVRNIAEPFIHMSTKQKQVHPVKLDLLQANIDFLKRKLEDIHNYNFIRVNCNEIQLNGDINFSRAPFPLKSKEVLKNGQPVKLSNTFGTPTYQLSLKSQSYAMGASASFILAREDRSTLVLFNRRNELDRMVTSDNLVYDICWCEVMKIFLIVGSQF